MMLAVLLLGSWCSSLSHGLPLLRGRDGEDVSSADHHVGDVPTHADTPRRLANKNNNYGVKPFDITTDLISLHYDYAPDRDDGHSAGLDRMILQDAYGCNPNLYEHILPITGTYGINANAYDEGAKRVMRKEWRHCGGYLDAHNQPHYSKEQAAAKWADTITKGGHVYVKEGGQSDFTYNVIQYMISANLLSNFNPKKQITVVQHSYWNEDHSTPAYLKYVKQNTDYVKVPDGNGLLRRFGSFRHTFESEAMSSKKWKRVWKEPLKFLVVSQFKPKNQPIVDASDTFELEVILGMGPVSIEKIANSYF